MLLKHRRPALRVWMGVATLAAAPACAGVGGDAGPGAAEGRRSSFADFLSGYFPGGRFETGQLRAACEAKRRAPHAASARVRLEVPGDPAPRVKLHLDLRFSELAGGGYRCERERSRSALTAPGRASAPRALARPCEALADLCTGAAPAPATAARWRKQVLRFDPFWRFRRLADEMCGCRGRACLRRVTERAKLRHKLKVGGLPQKKKLSEVEISRMRALVERAGECAHRIRGGSWP